MSTSISISDSDILASLGAAEQEENLPVTAPRSTGIAGPTSSTEERALELLGSGIAAANVASALGVTESAISQLLAKEEFANRVSTLRYERLQAHNLRDGKYDSLEDKLLDKLERSVPLMIKPETILKSLQVVNGAKRRGQSSPDQVANPNNIVNILLPKVITEKFVVNIDNQVIEAGNQQLLTMESGHLLQRTEEKRKETTALIEHSTQEEINDDSSNGTTGQEDTRNLDADTL